MVGWALFAESAISIEVPRSRVAPVLGLEFRPHQTRNLRNNLVNLLLDRGQRLEAVNRDLVGLLELDQVDQ
jgi:hypothetical protein